MPLDEKQQAQAWTLAAGLLGGMFRLPFERNLRWWQAISMTAAGGACAIFFAPVFNNLVPGHSTETLTALSFLLGLLGYRLVGAFILGFDRRAPELVDDAVDAVRDRVFPKKDARAEQASPPESATQRVRDADAAPEGAKEEATLKPSEGGEG